MVIQQSMSKMGLVGAIGVSLIFLSLTQIPFTHAEGPCIITSVSSQSPSTLHVKWDHYLGATNYFLDIRVINSTDIAPVVLTLPGSTKETDVHGLRPGAHYSVTLKVFQYYFVVCHVTQEASTVPATSQIIYRRALTSTSVRLEWARVPTTDTYIVLMEGQAGQNHQMILRNTSVVFTGLEPRTVYNCSVFTENEAGRGLRSALKPILTLAPPPNDIVVRQNGRQRARVSWQPVDRVLLYRVTIRNQDQPNSEPMVANATAPYLDFDTLSCTTYDISVSSFHRFLLPGEPNDVSFTSDAPSAASGVVVDYRCSSNTAVVSWVPVVGADSYRATATHNGTVKSCLSRGSQCQIEGMACGQSYVVSVITIAGDCESHGNSTTNFQTVSCAPDNLQLYRECSINLISLSWDRVNHTDHYIATLVDSMGEIQHCMTAGTDCIFTRTTCGRSYNFTVSSVTGDCSSQSSPPSFIRTAPCNPKTFTTSSSCHSDQVLVTWEPAAGAFYYEVIALGNQGPNDLRNCSSTGTNCTMHGIQCGQHLTTSLTAFDDECASRTLVNTVSETGPCVPQNVSATMDCGADSVTLSWEEAPGAMFYTGLAVDAAGRRSVCHTLGTSCRVEGLRCSTAYTASVVSSNSRCNSSESARVTVETASCPPDSVVATLDCGANQALVSWGSRPDTGSYTATLADPEGRLRSCSTTQHRCTVTSLRCGQRYTVSVNQHDGVCPSMPSSPVSMDSVACGPMDVNASVSCASGTLEVGWSATPGADRYTAALTRGDGQTLYCNASAPPCSIATSDCGQEYSVQVMSYSGTCRSFPSNTSVVREAPCVPTDLVVERICGNSSADVSWRASRGALRYDVMVAAAGGGGEHLGCSSSGSTACRLQGLTCGRIYNVSVVAVGSGCSSRSEAVAVRSAPCRPSQLTVRMDCLTNDALLTWDPSATATSYSAQATGPGGQELSCGPEPRSTCLLTGLRCGQRYAFTATAADGRCPGVDSLPLEQITAPCVPTGVLSAVDCSSNALAVSWTPFSIPVNYSVTAVDRTGGSASLSCSSVGGGGGGCVVAGLICGQQYSVTVRAQGDPCPGPSSAAQSVRSVPCAPASLRRVMDCPSNTVQASWDPAPGALSYVSTVTDAHNDSASCSTSFHGCSFPGLTCAQTYSFSVVALGNQCNSSVSHGAAVATAPCDPGNVQASLDCNTGVAMVTWTAGPGSVPYYTVVASAGGQPEHSVQTNVTSCGLDQLRCGEEYTVVVLAGDGSCNSSIYASTTVTTAPCAPQILSHEMLLNCSSTRALVAWAPDAHATSFSVSATTAGAAPANCSSSSSSSCVLDGLSCGRRYVGEAVALGDRCPSAPSTSFEILTAPCSPTNVVPSYTCGSSMALLRWDEARGRETFCATARAGEHTDSCTSAETHCSLLSLLCGRLYEVSVDAVATHCNSSRSGDAVIQTAPCAPQNVSASLECSGNTGRVSWLASGGATRYDVQALGRDGDSVNCTTNTTTCSLPGMHCAVTYTLTVTPYSDTCRGFASSPILYIAGPCPPLGVAVSLTCQGNVGTVSWQPAVLADSYQAWATGHGHAHTCNATAGATQCSFTDLHCGETNAVTVATTERGCQSAPSAPVSLDSALCPPTGLSGAASCLLDVIQVSWDPSPVSSVLYNLHSGGGVTPLPGTSYTTGLLPCGVNVSFAVSAQDPICTSALSETLTVAAVPCAPSHLNASTQCGTQMGLLTWRAGVGATGYVATATGDNGHVSSCSSNGTSCSVWLECGQGYTAAVLSSTSDCNSSTAATVDFTSAPCLPTNIEAELDCSSNSFTLRWDARAGSSVSYMAVAIGTDGSRLGCHTSSTECPVTGLSCGVSYGITVIPSTANCGSIDSADYHIQSAPCPPQSASVVLECSTNVAMVRWSGTGPAQDQVVTAVDTRGNVALCSTPGTNCTFGQLSCGETYALTVVGHSPTCQSNTSAALSLHSAPCVPTHPAVTLDCNTNIAVVTWDSARGAVSYTVSARGGLGHNSACPNADTTCAFSDLLCGQDYSLTVVAHNPDHCHSAPSENTTTTTVPCRQSGLSASLQCSTNTAVVSWTPAVGILTYNSSAEAIDVTDTRSCATSGPGCNISSLLCGERYRVVVSGQGRTCPSPAVDWRQITTAPCQPTLLSVVSSCDSDSIAVSWRPSQGSDNYRVVAEAPDGSTLNCTTGATDCRIAGLRCGQRYSVHVVGVNAGCPGERSHATTLQTAPCVPRSVVTELDCRAGSLNVTWQRSSDARGYVATVTRVRTGHPTSCNTTETHCLAAGLECGADYNVTVLAYDHACSSAASPVQLVATAPCPPLLFDTPVDCGTNVVSVSWNGSAAGTLYTAMALGSDGQRHDCTGRAGCSLSTLGCATEYNVSITPARGACMGSQSPTQLVRTAPCVPRLRDVEMDCLSESAWVKWEDPVRNLGQNYTVTSTDQLGQVERFECSDTLGLVWCAVPNMTCGRHLNFTLTASDQQCPSGPSNMIMTETAPCPPLHVRAAVGCENRTASVSWRPSPDALTYTATLEHADGQTTCCTTAGTGCDIAELPCGNMFVLLVTAEGRTCNSSQSPGSIIRTEPCIPLNLRADLSCSSNVASIRWDLSQGGQQYRVEARNGQGHLVDECRNYDDNCELTRLACGQLYAVTVAAENSDCTSAPSDSVEIRTAPCTPANASAAVDCLDNALTVSWSQSSGADSYRATIMDANGQNSSCVAMAAGNCSLSGLSCGKMYRVSVVASDGVCDSPPTDVMETHSAPCEPGSVEALMDCASQTALLSWGRAAGAVGYTVTASPVFLGDAVTRNTSATTVAMEGLQCGQAYFVFVKTQGGTCDSGLVHMSGLLLTQPCVPSHIYTAYTLGIGQVSWDPAAGADRYTARAVTSEGAAVSCDTIDTNCDMQGLNCSQLYNVSVQAHNSACNDSVVSLEPEVIQTEPCAPYGVLTRVECDADTATVSWESSQGALSYVVNMDGRNGHSLSCHTFTTSCTLDGVHCGTVYYASVVALGDRLNSSGFNTVVMASAPCAAAQLEVEVDCLNDTAAVSWVPALGAVSYTATATAADGHRQECESQGASCLLTELQCGQVYSLVLRAINEQCQTLSTEDVTFSTRPCPPQRLGVDLLRGASSARLHWEQQPGVVNYTATANCSDHAEVTECVSTDGTTCEFSALHCGESYQFSVVAHTSMCPSEVSGTVEIQTELCQVSLSVNGSCDSETLMMNWTEATGALTYLITAEGDLGWVRYFQTNDTMLEVELLCGQSYTFTARAQGQSGDGPVSAPAHFIAAPCAPHDVEAFVQCEDHLGSVSWALSDGADTYTAVAIADDGHTHICFSHNSTCTFDDLHCGEHYQVHVVAHDHVCPSAPSNSTSIRMAPCIPTGLQATLDCSVRVATLTWDRSEGAVVYNVTAETSGGHVLSAGTAGTVAQFSDLQCGQTYFLSVQAVESVCRSVRSPAITLESAPCPPTNVNSSMDCLSNIAVVTWSASAGAEFYTAAVTDWQGGETCMSSSEQCGMPNLDCGQNYTVTVTALRQNCPSEPSASSTLQSVPCLPSGVDIVMNCSAQEAAVSWSPSQGALSYAVSAMSALGEMSRCASTGPGCTLTNLTCGQSYRVQVLALDNICSSLPSRVAVFSTEPCRPVITSTVLDCYTDTALVEWTRSGGALSYTTTARSDGNHVVTCTTNYTNCELGPLECSQTYTLSTVASGDTCNSDVSGSVQLPSVPCPPSAVVMEEVCSAHMAHVRWDPVVGADSYLVQAFGVEEHFVQCASVSGACTLRDLLCGFTYNVTVLAVNSVCNVSESAVSVLPAEPCAPNMVQAALDCESGAVAVSWEASQGALSYTAVAQGNGFPEPCNTTGTTCQFSALPCGLSYSVFVRAIGEDCSSADSTAVQIDSVPCEPQQVAAVMECSNDTGLVSWEQSEGGLPYQVRAFGADGHEVVCSSAGDGCELPSMHCGQLYNLTVTALDGQCDNVRANLNLQSVPCRPTNVRTSMPPCPFTQASVAWEHARGAQTYAVQAGWGVSCNATTATSCPLGDLLCGHTYNVSVVAADGVCSSPESAGAQLSTAPCPPQDVSLSMECEAGILTVSWAPDPDADAFVATLVSDTSARHTCVSAGTACSVAGLPCGQRYTVSVVAAREGCESEPSAPLEISSAPCVPRNPEGRLDCVTNSAWVSWDNTGGALRYTALTEALTGDHNSSCTALPSAGSCAIPHLKCGTEYVFRVVGANDVCMGGYSNNFTLETAPCSLENITAVHECGSNRILVSWENTPGSPQYVVTAEGPDQWPISCNSTFSSCELQGAACGTQYTVMVSASSDKCSSLRSPPMDVTTAPCVPRSVVVGRSCEEDGAMVSWSPSPMVTSFLLTATGASGDVRTCETADANCTLARLPCGEAYTVNVTASDGNCTSEPSVDVFFQTMPCQPTQLSVDYQCEANESVVSWTPSEGSLQYHLYASPELGGAPMVCSTPHTSCRMALECGSVYNLSVVASDGLCNSSFSAPLRFGAAPCAPDSVRVRVRLIDGMQLAMATWPAVACRAPVKYLVSLEGRIQDDPRARVDLWSYPTDRLYYEFPVPCSTVFNLTVRSVNGGGVSVAGPHFHGLTAPCPPADVRYSIELFDRITVVWDESVFATGYTVYSSSGAICNTSTVFCQFLEADPDSLWVTASNAVGESEPSSNITGPVFVRGRRDLRSNEVAAGSLSALSTPGSVRLEARPAASLYVAWMAVQDATLYTVIVKQPSAARPALVTTVDTEFTTLGGLEPLTRYCVTLAAKNALGQSPYSTPQCLATGAPE